MKNNKLTYRYYEFDNPLLSINNTIFEQIKYKIDTINNIKDNAIYFKNNSAIDINITNDYSQIDLLSNYDLDDNCISGIITTFNVINTIDSLDDSKFLQKQLELKNIVQEENNNSISYFSHYYFCVYKDLIMVTLQRNQLNRFIDFIKIFLNFPFFTIVPLQRNIKKLPLSRIKKIEISSSELINTSITEPLKRAFSPSLTNGIINKLNSKIVFNIPKNQKENENYLYKFIDQFEYIRLYTNYGKIINNNKNFFLETISEYDDTIENEKDIFKDLKKFIQEIKW